MPLLQVAMRSSARHSAQRSAWQCTRAAAGQGKPLASSCTPSQFALPCTPRQATFPSASLAGFFCNGEIGPVPPDELVPDDGQAARMMGYSTVACMLKLVPAPPPPPDWSG